MLNSEGRIAELLANSGFAADMEVYKQIGEYLAANATYCLPFKIDDYAWCIEDGYIGDGRIYGVELGRNCRGGNECILYDGLWLVV